MSNYYSGILHNFSVTIPGCQHFIFSHSQDLECFACRMFSFDLWSNSFKSGVGRHLLYLPLFNQFSYMLFLFAFFFFLQHHAMLWLSSVTWSETNKKTTAIICWVIVKSGLDKLRTWVRDVLKIISLTNCRTWLFFTTYAHEHTFSVYDLRLTILNPVVVSTINLQWSCLPAFSYPPLQTI